MISQHHAQKGYVVYTPEYDFSKVLKGTISPFYRKHAESMKYNRLLQIDIIDDPTNLPRTFVARFPFEIFETEKECEAAIQSWKHQGRKSLMVNGD